MIDIVELGIESALLSIINGFGVYIAAFIYELNWGGVLTAMVFISILSAQATHFLLNKWLSRPQREQKKIVNKTLVSEGLGVLLVALISSFAVLIILSFRFRLPMALSISLLSGMIGALVRHLLS